jgi:hypothetical protein
MDLNQWLSEHLRIIPGSPGDPDIIAGVGRENLALWFKEWGFTKGVEVGTFMGRYAEVLCESNPYLHLTCVDPWVAYSGYKDYSTQRALTKGYDVAKEKLSKYNCTLVREFSLEAAKQFPDGFFDFVYIDANHELPWVIQDLYAWIPKVKKGGVISGHDYLFCDLAPVLQVVPAVKAYVQANRIGKWYVLGRERKATNNPRKLPKYARTWMWINGDNSLTTK